jgi:hypothetical protein
MAQCAGGNLNSSVEASAPLSEFADSDDGTLRHRRTGLIWQRCALGQTWDGSDCLGSPTTMDWSSALIAATNHVQAGEDDWRLPNRNELASILENRCFNPALDAEAFPSASAIGFWSSTPVSGGDEIVWVVDLVEGAVLARSTEMLQGVRLVRGRF